jgi:hypothetical protein
VVFADTNKNGSKDAGEAALPNVAVSLTHAQTGFVRQTTTSATGSYLFAEVPAGSYLFAATLPDPYASVAKTVEVATGTNPAVNVAAEVQTKVYLPNIQR